MNIKTCANAPISLLVALILGASLVAACSTQGEESRNSSSKQGSLAAQRAPNFAIRAYQGADALGGQEATLTGVVGRGKPVVLNFWAGLCPPCRAEMPDFEKVHQQFHSQVLIVGVDIGPYIGLGSTEDGQALLRQLKVTYPAGLAADGSVVRAYGILGMPTTIFIKPDGTVFRSHSGLLNEAQLSSAVKALLNAS